MIAPPSQEKIKEKMKNLSMSQLFELLGANQKSGLSSDHAKSRLIQFDFNEIPEIRKNYVFLIVKKFWGPSAWIEQ